MSVASRNLFSFSNSISSPYGHGGKPEKGGLICRRRKANVSMFSPHLIEAQHAQTKMSSSSKHSGGSEPPGEATLPANPSQAGRRRADTLLVAARTSEDRGRARLWRNDFFRPKTSAWFHICTCTTAWMHGSCSQGGALLSVVLSVLPAGLGLYP